jgi:hypothetical protein
MRLIAILCMACLTVSAFAKLVARKDPLNGVLDAQLVVIVEPSPDAFGKLVWPTSAV